MLIALLLALVPGTEVVRDWLTIAPTERGGRRPFSPSAVFDAHIARRDAAAPKVGDTLQGESGEEQRWTERKTDADGSLGGEIGWAYARVESPTERTVLAKLTGASRLFVNGAGFVGDAYGYGFGGVPVALRKGANDLYVGGVRGSFRLELTDVAGPLVAGSWDHLIPDIVVGDSPRKTWAEMLVWNASSTDQDVVVTGVTGIEAGTKPEFRDEKRLHAGAAWRFPLPLGAERRLRQPTVPEGEKGEPHETIVAAISTVGFRIEEGIDIPVRQHGAARRVAFESDIDGSWQAYSMVPAQNEGPQAVPRVLLSLHGASVDALGQARAYAPKEDIMIVCPTNRRPYGFDWQDWGRLDAYEALDDFLEHTREFVLPGSTRMKMRPRGHAPAERARAHIVLTGHSMGGHGTWSLAANDPDAFDAIGPSAGWASFDSYGGRPDGALKSLWSGADFASRTEDLAANLVALPTFVLHGTADDNVPASEAHDMIARLEALGGKPASHFQEGAGHWWDGDASAGADCVDYPGILALFDAQSTGDPNTFTWIGADPGIDSHHRWIEVLQPLVYGRPFRVSAKRGATPKEIEIETDNVRTLRFGQNGKFLRASIDGHATGRSWPTDDVWMLTAEGWGPASSPPVGKTPERCGPFKRAFDHRFVLVFGTAGEPDEDRELFERARYDQESWWYRANGTPELVSDVEFLARDFTGRNVILYGNRDTNSAWSKLIAVIAPVDARRGALRLGERTFEGEDLGAVFVLPRADDTTALVGAFADSGARGSRLGYALLPFVSGVGYPDYALFSSAILRSGDGGVLAAGWFSSDWHIDPKQFVATK